MSLLHRLTFCESLKGSKLFVVFPYNTVLAVYDPGHKVCIVFTHVSTLVLPLIYILDVVHFFWLNIFLSFTLWWTILGYNLWITFILLWYLIYVEIIFFLQNVVEMWNECQCNPPTPALVYSCIAPPPHHPYYAWWRLNYIGH